MNVIQVTAFISIQVIETLVKKDIMKKKIATLLCLKEIFLKCILTFFSHIKKMLPMIRIGEYAGYFYLSSGNNSMDSKYTFGLVRLF